MIKHQTKHRLKATISSSLTILVLLFTISARCGVYTYNKDLKGTGITASASVTTKDDQFDYMTGPGSATWASEFVNHTVNNRAVLRYDESAGGFYSSSWSLDVGVTMQKWDDAGSSMTSITGTLTISYDPQAGYTYDDLSLLTTTDAHKTTVTVDAYNLTGISAIPKDVILENTIEIERYYFLDQSATFSSLAHSVNTTNNTMTMSWDYIPGAEEYDLEWVHVSTYDPNTYSGGVYSGFDYEKRATRITTSNQSYTINLTYGSGAIKYRVRAVGRKGSNYELRDEGEWDEASSYQTVSELYPIQNWTYVGNYTEEGKAKELLTFADGSSRNRQSITKNNTEDIAIFNETFYDYEGRPVIQTLPTPEKLRTKKINYFESFNLNYGESDLFRKEDYDNDDYYTNCLLGINGLDNAQGSQNYYSSDNPDVANAYNAYLPQANNFPYTHTVYGDDGRVKLQGGPGENHTIGSGHETQYYHATPMQDKLDRLFGNEAGYAQHYRQKAVKDPNGQLSVSYENLAGQVVATSLAGEAPDNLEELSSLSVTSYTQSFNDLNHFVKTEDAWKYTTRFLVTNANSDYIFTDTITPAQYQSLCTDSLHDCEYLMDITIYDDCKHLVNEGTADSAHYIFTISYPTELTNSVTLQFPSVGVYTIEKELKLSNSKLNEEVAKFKAALPGNCIISRDSILNAYLDSLDWSECDSCNEIEYAINCEPSVDSADVAEGCETLLAVMKSDMSINGQHFDWLPAGTTTASATFFDANISSVPNFWTDFDSYVSSNCPITIDFTDTDNQSWAFVRSNWQDCYADYFVSFHPEYCHYEACQALVTSDQFDINMNSNDTYTWANTEPGGGKTYIGGTTEGLDLLDIDPFFVSGGIGAAESSTMSGKITSYTGGNSMWDHAGTTVGCTSCDDQWKYFRSIYQAEKAKLVAQIVATGTTTATYTLSACKYLCDGSMPPDFVTSPADSCNTNYDAYGHTFTAIASGFQIRKPSLMAMLDQIEDDINDMDTDNESRFGDRFSADTCGIADTLTVDITVCASMILTGPDNVEINLMPCYSYGTCIATCTTTPCVAQHIVDNINDDVTCDTTGGFFSAFVTSDPAIIKIVPSNYLYYGLPINTFTLSYNGWEGTFQGGSPPCPKVQDCFCTELNYLRDNYNLKDSAQTNYMVNHTTYSTQYEYMSAVWDSTYGITIDEDSILVWMTNCDSYDSARVSASDPLIPDTINCNLVKPNCEEDILILANHYADQKYRKLVQQAVDTFITAYKAACFSGDFYESHYVRYSDKEHHYTLYYYDQAGNLTRTVPPKGVDILSTTEVRAVQRYRLDPVTYSADYTIPVHTYTTSYTYNSRNQVIEQTTPDAGTTYFWYDRTGRLRFSRNAEQNNYICVPTCPTGYRGHYSYTLYDDQGRIKEVGQSEEIWTDPITTNPSEFYNAVDDQNFPSDGEQVTSTYYDTYVNATIDGYFSNGQENIRNRVVTTTYEETDDNDDDTYDQGSHYSYDVHGNVHTYITENTDLTSLGMHLRTTQYEYELLSGNVKAVHYQAGAVDAMHQFYEYDADNRLSDVYTCAIPNTSGGLDAPYEPLAGGDRDLMTHDAKYIYYTHGPVARMELGNKQVQGMDYAYTIQGWIKGMNANILDHDNDMGKDANDGNGYISSAANIHKKFGADAYGYTLGYFANTPTDGGTDFYDYQAINTTYGDNFHDDVLDLNDVDLNLFNGNIKSMAVALSKDNGANPPTIMSLMDNQYSYDQLNRLVANTTYTTSSTSSYASATSGNKYKTTYTYDANGNITALTRYDHTAALMDNLTYNYTSSTNKIEYIDDAVGASVYGTDIGDQSAANYSYDEIGNLTLDASEEIEDIEWTVYGKIKSITRTTNSHNFPDLEFEYDPAGNRVMKLVKPRTAGVLSSSDEWTYTYYSRDPQGNVLATYEKTTVLDAGACSPSYTVFKLEDLHLYGSSRLGTYNRNFAIVDCPSPFSTGSTAYTRTLGKVNYELTNHLGNVMAVVSDRKVPVNDGSGNLDYYAADIVSSNDLYPGHSILPGRSSNPTVYRYGGSNGQEADDEITGSRSHYSAEYWEYDSRILRRWENDPVVKPWESPYATFSNNSVLYSDPLGLNSKDKKGPGDKKNKTGRKSTTGGSRSKVKLPDEKSDAGNKSPDLKIKIDNTQLGFEGELIDKISFSSKDYFRFSSNNFNYSIATSRDNWQTRYTEFKYGLGATNMVYGPSHPFTEAAKGLGSVGKARDYYYNKYYRDYQNGTFFSAAKLGNANVTRFDGAFIPVIDNFNAGLNMYQQYIGTCKINVFTSEDAQRLIFVVSNTTGKKSYQLHFPWVTDIPRSTVWGGVPESTILNLYIWSEPLNYGMWNTLFPAKENYVQETK